MNEETTSGKLSERGSSLNSQLSSWLDLLFPLGLMTLTVMIPLFFWNITTEFYETPKFLILVAATSLFLITGVVRSLMTGKITVTKTPLDLPLLLLLAVFIVSTFFSQARWSSIYGNLPRINGSLASLVVYTVFYFCLVSSLKQINLVKKVIYLLITSGVALSILSLLSYVSVTIFPLLFTQAVNFTPTGSNFSTNAILVLCLPFIVAEIFKQQQTQMVKKLIFAAVLTLFGVVIILTGTLPIYISAVIALCLVILTAPSVFKKETLPFIIFPLITATVVAVAAFTPLGGSNNIIYNRAQNFPREAQLPLDTSWKISVSTFRDYPFWGSGPSTYLSNFTIYKPLEFNSSQLWDIRFDQAFNEYLQILATAGATGFLALLLFTAVFLSRAFKAIRVEDTFKTSLAIAGILFFVLLALHTSTVVLWVIGLIILASFMAAHENLTEDMNLGFVSVPERSVKGKIGSDDVNLTIGNYFLNYILGIVVIVFVGSALYLTTKAVMADVNHRQALNAVASGQGLQAYNYLISAETLNPYIDLYRLDLAQTNFALAEAIASSKGPSQASPAGSLTDQDKQNIQTLLSQAINESRAAVTLNPNNPANWEVMGSIYRRISGVAQNALSFGLDSYGRAIQKDPLNPLLRLTVGGIYYSAGNFELAVKFFTDTINLKPDYANAYYNLSIALKDKGDLQGALAAAEKTVSLLKPDSQDYKIASDLLSSLKEKESKIAEEGENLGKASGANSALESGKLPKVLNLPKPDSIASPPAVKKEQ